MRAVQKTVYYCDWCKRHRLTRRAIEDHEPHCFKNPDRVCRWNLAHVDHRHVYAAALAAEVRERGVDLEWLREETDGCPACMLAAVVQSGLSSEERGEFDYAAEVERCREDERKAPSW